MKKIFQILLMFILTNNCITTSESKDLNDTIYNGTLTLAEVLQIVSNRYFDTKDVDTCFDSAIEAFLNELDPHSNYIRSKDYTNIKNMMSGEFGGIGIIIFAMRKTKDRFLPIEHVIPDGPADKAGVKAHDKIIEIDGTLIEGMPTDEALAKLKGKKGTKVTIKVLRNENELLTFEITRDNIKEQNSICFDIEPHHISYLALHMFTDNSVQQMEKLLHEIHKKQYKGLILDLRNNSGGLLQAAVDIASLFVEKNTLIASTKDKNLKETERYVTKRQPIKNLPRFVIILINNYSASASEILAGCLKEYSNQKSNNPNAPIVILVGDKSFGKGSVQEIIPIRCGNKECAVKITIALYYLADGKSIQGIGINPDVLVEKKIDPPAHIKWFNEHYGSEQSLTNYIKQKETNEKDGTNKNINTKDKETKKEESKDIIERTQEVLKNDNQFLEAISILNMLHFAEMSSPKNIKNRHDAVTFLQSIIPEGNKLVMTPIK